MHTIQKSPGRAGRFVRRYWEDYAFIAPYLLLFIVFTIVPVAIAIGFSFCYFNGLEAPVFIGLENYFTLLLDDALFTKAFVNTLALAVVTGPVGFLLCLFLAWLVNEFSPKLRAVMTLLFYAPSISGGVYMSWSLIYSGDSYGLLNGLLMGMGVIYEPVQWLTDSKVMFGAAVAVILWTSLGTSFLSFIAGFQAIDSSIYESGAIDGVHNRFQEFYYLTLPSMRPQLMFGAIMQITASFSVSAVPIALTGFPSTNNSTTTIVTHIMDMSTNRIELGYACSIAVFLFLLMLITRDIVSRIIKSD